MGQALDHLVTLLDLERIDENLYRGQNERTRWGRLFGGQIAAQALAAAQRTVEEDRRAHSFHGYFLRGGDPKVPVLFQVDRIRDGASFTTRRVVAVQDGKAIFSASISFHVHEDGYEHQDEMPEVAPPEAMLSWSDRAREAGDRLPAEMREWMLAERPIETRSADAHSWFSTEPQRGTNPAWVRANGELRDDPALHACLLAYASDMGFVDNMYRPHRSAGPRAMLASLDHSLWFHRAFRMDDWLLYVQESPTAAAARGFARGTFYDRAGRLVCSVVQEGLMGEIDPAKAKKVLDLEPQR